VRRIVAGALCHVDNVLRNLETAFAFYVRQLSLGEDRVTKSFNIRSGLFVTLLGFAVTTGIGCGGSSNPPKADAKVDARDGGDATAGAGGNGGGGSGGGGTGGGTAGTDGGGGASDAKDGGDAGDVNTEVGGEVGPEAGAGDAKDGGDAGDAKDGGDAIDGPTCTNVCTLGGHQCGPNGGAQTCVTAATGCTVWGAETACGTHQTCMSGVCTCNAPPAGCTAAGKFCNASGGLVTCTADAQGCFTASAAAACPTHTTCKGTLPGAACTCDNTCTGSGAFCVDANTAGTCMADGNTPACHTISAMTDCAGSTTCVGGACVCPAVGTTAGSGCTTLAAKSCSGDDVLTCVTETASGCSIWQASTHCANNAGGRLTCGTKAGAPSCQCPENTATNVDVFVDPVAGSDTGGASFATGIQTPAACRFASLTKGLAVTGVRSVTAISATLPAAFGGETLPLAIPAGVTVTTADAVPTPADYVISFNNGAATAAATLGSGATLKGFTIRNSSGNTAATLVTCAAGGATLDTLVLDGNNMVSGGVAVTGTCAATIKNTVIEKLAGTGLALLGSGTSTVAGGTISTTLVGLWQQNGTVTVTNTNIAASGQNGVLMNTGAPNLTLTNSTVKGSTADGVVVAKGSLTATGTAVTGNGGSGIDISTGTAVNLTTVDVSSNAAGLNISGGTVTTSGVTASSSTGTSGIVVGGGNVSIASPTLTANNQHGLLVSGGTVTLTNGLVASNNLAGVRAIDGTLTSTGTEVRLNKTNGLELAGAVASVTGVNVHGNVQNGVVVSSPTGVTVNLGAPGSTTTVGTNGGAGLLVTASPATASDANSLVVDTVGVTSNVGAGINVTGSAGNATVTIKNNAVSGNGDTGILIAQGVAHTTRTAIQGNDVTGNRTTAASQVGGAFFSTASTLTSFISNKIHGNGGDELGFGAAPNSGTWDISPASNACDATSNSLYAYGTGAVGLNVTVPVVLVNAQYTHWVNVSPAFGVDYSATLAAQVDVTNACTPVP
jgi:hypothetical protein